MRTRPTATCPSLDQQAADGDGAVHFATHVQVQQRAAVNTAPGWPARR
jgi:hypothetical protein